MKDFSQAGDKHSNPFLVSMNVPVAYSKVTAKDLDEYTKNTVDYVTNSVMGLKNNLPLLRLFLRLWTT